MPRQLYDAESTMADEMLEAAGLILAGSLIGGAVTLSTQFLQRRWTRDDAELAIAHESLLRKEAEERQARRNWRTGQVGPINDYVRRLNRALGQQAIDQLNQRMGDSIDMLVEQATQKGLDPRKALLYFKKAHLEDSSGRDVLDDQTELLHDLPNVLRTAPTPEIRQGLIHAVMESLQYLYASPVQAVPTRETDKLTALLEDYISSVP